MCCSKKVSLQKVFVHVLHLLESTSWLFFHYCSVFFFFFYFMLPWPAVSDPLHFITFHTVPLSPVLASLSRGTALCPDYFLKSKRKKKRRAGVSRWRSSCWVVWKTTGRWRWASSGAPPSAAATSAVGWWRSGCHPEGEKGRETELDGWVGYDWKTQCFQRLIRPLASGRLSALWSIGNYSSATPANMLMFLLPGKTNLPAVSNYRLPPFKILWEPSGGVIYT